MLQAEGELFTLQPLAKGTKHQGLNNIQSNAITNYRSGKCLVRTAGDHQIDQDTIDRQAMFDSPWRGEAAIEGNPVAMQQQGRCDLQLLKRFAHSKAPVVEIEG